MKIAFVVHAYDKWHGHGRYVVELARRLAAKHDVDVWADAFAEPPDERMTFQHVPAWRRSALLNVLTFLASSSRLVRQRHYDVVHSQGMTCWRANVITAHICNAARAAGSEAGWRSRLFTRVVVPLERSFYRRNAGGHLIAISHRVARDVAAHYGWKNAASVIYHGTDCAEFTPVASADDRRELRKSFGLDPKRWTWLFVGEATKGLAEVIRQLSTFRDSQLLVISRSKLESFRRVAQVSGVGDRIIFHGPTDAVRKAYQSADVFLYPSDYDAFGLVVAEAMATGLPVIVGRDIGAAEWIDDGVNGLLVDHVDPAAISAALARLHDNEAAAIEVGRRARETVAAFSWDRCAEETEAVYERVVAEQKSSPRVSIENR